MNQTTEEPKIKQPISIEDILTNIKSAVGSFIEENKRVPTKAFLGRKLFRRLIHAEKLERTSIKLTEKLYERFRLNTKPAQGIEFYEQGKFFREERVNKKKYQSILKNINQIKLPLILTSPGWRGKKLKYAESYEIGVSKTSHSQAY